MFGDKLKELRKSRQLSMDELATKYNTKFNGKLNKGTLSRYENNLQEPMINVVKNLAEFFGVPIGMLTEDVKTSFDIFSIPNIMPLPQTKQVPLLGDIACGQPILAVENIEDYVRVSKDVNVDFALKCKGDSMINARIYDGDIVFIKSQPDVENGEIAAVLIGVDETEATLKKVYKYPSKIVLRACNPMYEDIIYTKEELNEIHIIGKAVIFTSVVR